MQDCRTSCRDWSECQTPCRGTTNTLPGKCMSSCVRRVHLDDARGVGVAKSTICMNLSGEYCVAVP